MPSSHARSLSTSLMTSLSGARLPQETLAAVIHKVSPAFLARQGSDRKKGGEASHGAVTSKEKAQPGPAAGLGREGREQVRCESPRK